MVYPFLQASTKRILLQLMRYIYTFGVLFYASIIRVAALFNPKAAKWVEGRKHWQKKLPDLSSEHVIWFHCASLGEFDAGLPLMNALKEENPEIFLVVTFFSPSGMDNYHKRKHYADWVGYLPVDTKRNSKILLEHFKPKALFIVKYEFWSNLIEVCSENKVKLFSVSTILRENQRFFRWYGAFFRKTLKHVDYFFVQNETTCLLLSDIDINNYKLTGDTRFDRVIENKRIGSSNSIIESFLKGQKAIILGSIWPDDEKAIFPYVQQHSEQKFIIAPHNIDEKHLESIENQLSGLTIRYTDFLEKDASKNILILNTIGHLTSAFQYGKIAYIGGGFSGNLHNILEPAVYGMPIIFGPIHTKFPEANMFIRKGIGFSVSTSKEVIETINSIEGQLDYLALKSMKIVQENTGSTHKIMSLLREKYAEILP
jgi:3-deoxy-D-manno-octulosonic-acid transferase